MVSGKPKQTVQAATAPSAYQGIQNYNVGIGGFGSGNSTRSGDTLTTNSSLDPQMQPLYNSALGGVKSASNYLQDPTAAYQQIQNGGNALYNQMDTQLGRQEQSALGQAQLQASQSGLENSTTLGGAQGQIAYDHILGQQNNAVNAMNWQQQQALQGGQFNSGLLSQLYGMAGQSGAMANQDLQTGFNAQDQNAMYNATNQQQASTQNAQLAAQAQARQSQFYGNLISAGLGLAAIPIAGAAGFAGAGAGMLGGGTSAALSLGSNMAGGFGNQSIAPNSTGYYNPSFIQ